MSEEPSGLHEIESEQDWHEFLQPAMEAAGWYVVHEAVCNEGRERADFIAFHSELTDGLDGEWVGIECKYTDSGEYGTRALEAAQQIARKYKDKTWGKAKRSIDLWVAAPYVAQSHGGDRTAVAAARGRELEACRFLNELGYGYLLAWHPKPSISFISAPDELRPRQADKIYTHDIPAFRAQEVLDPWERVFPHENVLDERAEMMRASRAGSGVLKDREKLWSRGES